MKRLQDADVKDKKVLVRVGYNVPIKGGKVADDERIVASLKTLEYLLKHGATLILMAHLGRPDGQPNKDFSLEPVVSVLERLIKKSVQFVPECVGPEREKAVTEAKNGDIILLENTRFYAEEEANDSEFAKKLSEGCDVFVNDAFPDSHRAHASVVGVTAYLPSFGGFALQNEVDNLSKLLGETARPFVFISGGAKISDKVDILKNLLGRIDVLLIGGGMANTFLCSKGYTIGCSLTQADYYGAANEILEAAEEKGVAVFLPEDVVTTKKVEEKAKAEEKDVEDVDEKDIIADIGSLTVKNFAGIINDAKTIFWNGPLGIAEYPEFASGTKDIAEAVANSKAYSVIGGGDTIASIDDKLKDKFSFVSMAGGASMEFLEGKSLPGIEALK